MLSLPGSRAMAVTLGLLLCVIACGFFPARAFQSGPIILENEALRVSISPKNGAFLSIFNKRAGLELVGDSRMAERFAPWELFVGDSDSPIKEFVSFDPEQAQWQVQRQAQAQEKKQEQAQAQAEPATAAGGARRLSWTTAAGMTVRVDVRLGAGGEPLQLWALVENPTETEVAGLSYPILRGLGALAGDGAQDYLAHPVSTGFLFKNPTSLFSSLNRGVQHARYPSFEGATMQFMAYYTAARGGFYLAAHDPFMTAKEVNFFRDPDSGGLAASFRHWNWDRRPGTGLDLGYPVAVAPLKRGDWYEAADLYRAWAASQDWVARGRLADRAGEETARWLNEGIGLSSFGAKGNVPAPRFFQKLHDVAASPVLHILYGWPVPDGTNLNRANLNQIRGQGDRVSSFENDIIVPVGARDFNREAAVEPYQEVAWGAWKAAWMDPTTAYIRERQQRRAVGLVDSFDVDAFYYDISTSFGPLGCLNTGHGHPKGHGRWMIEGYQGFHTAVRSAAQSRVRAGGANYVPMGTEGIHEAALKVLDFYQARANSYPACFDFEGRQFRAWIEAGTAQVIPLFTYVYHEYGGLRLDGWGQLSDEEGDYAYAIAARTVLWGGIYELNFEFERFNTEPGDAKVRFLRSLAAARTGFGRDYLAYGRMIAAPEVVVSGAGTIELGYRVRNLPFGQRERKGRQRVAAVVVSAWQSASGNIAVFMVNVDGSGPRQATVRLDPELYGWSGTRAYVAESVGATGRKPLIAGRSQGNEGRSQGKQSFSVTLAPREVVMLEFRPVPTP